MALRNHCDLEELDAFVKLQESYSKRQLDVGDNPLIFFGNLQEDWTSFGELGKSVADDEKPSQVWPKIGPRYPFFDRWDRMLPLAIRTPSGDPLRGREASLLLPS